MQTMKCVRQVRFIALLTFLLALGASSVFAAASGPVDRDVTIVGGAADNAPGGDANIVRATSTSGVAGPCTAAITAAFSRDVSAPNSGLDAKTATLMLRISAVSLANAYPLTLTLFDTAGGADIAEPSTSAALGSDLGSTVTLNSAPPPGTIITFPTTPAFVAAVNTAITGDKRLTVLVQITGCPNNSVYTVDFSSHESGNAGTFSFVDTNAVEITTFHADGAEAAPSWFLYIGSAAILILGSVGLVARRRGRA